MSLACPACDCTKSMVTETRTGPQGWPRRRRRCADCGMHWTTLEVPESLLTIEQQEVEQCQPES